MLSGVARELASARRSRSTFCFRSNMRPYRYFVYMMQSTSRHALYIGVTSKLVNRVWQHKKGTFEGFTADYKCERLVYYEIYDRVQRAIAREKQLKGWRREKKEWLIARMNPHWKDLSEGWFEAETKGPSTTSAKPASSARDDNPETLE
jgi:putative endonuclease